MATKWERIASEYAEQLHKEAAEWHWGIRPVDDDKGKVIALCYYSYHPHGRDRTLFRNEEFASLRDWMRAEGLDELAFANYPLHKRDGAGWTFAMLIQDPEGQHDQIHEGSSAPSWSDRSAPSGTKPKRRASTAPSLGDGIPTA